MQFYRSSSFKRLLLSFMTTRSPLYQQEICVRHLQLERNEGCHNEIHGVGSHVRIFTLGVL